MSTRRRNKDVDYEDDDLTSDYYDSDDDYSEDDEDDDDAGTGDPRVSRAERLRAKIEAAQRRAPVVKPQPAGPPKELTEFEGDKKHPPRKVELPSKPSINLVIIGHVDAGKSTLVGHLLLQVNAVTATQISKCLAESAASGKGSFGYAWVMDEGSDERARGITIDVCVKYFHTESKNFTVLDAPGHAEFVPNMILGALQADVAVLVVDAADFEATFHRGRAKEHCRLVRALGIKSMVVAVNKMDAVGWSQERFELVRSTLHDFLTSPGPFAFANSALQFVPVSAFDGVNLATRGESAKMPAWPRGCLLDALDALTVDSAALQKAVQQPLRALVVESVPGRQLTTVAVKVVVGTVSVNEALLALPSETEVMTRRITLRGATAHEAVAGDYVEVLQMVAPLDSLPVGTVLIGAGRRPKVGKQVRVRIAVIDPVLPIVQGQTLTCHLHAEQLPAVVLAIEKGLNKQTGEPLKNRPKALKEGDLAIVLLQFSQKVVFEDSGGPLGRVLLRERGKTAAAGTIVPATE